MALVDLKSNLRKSNVYKDTPGGGNSGLPYIKQGLPEDSPAGEYLASIAENSIDTDVRGGLYSVIASTTDTIRISRFLTDFPRGSAFTSKQIGLQKSNPLVETERRGDTINTQVYNLNSNLLAQIALQGTGEHVPRAGFNVNNLLKDENKYEKIVKVNNELGQNRLVTLYDTKIKPDPDFDNLTSNLTKLGISKDNNTLFDYVGGPGSSYGLGNTFIARSTFTTKAPKGQVVLQKPLDDKVLLGFSTFKDFSTTFLSGSYEIKNTEYQQGYGLTAVDFIRPEKIPEGISPVNQFGNTMGYSALLKSKVGELQDFRRFTIEPNSQSRDYNDKQVNIATRVGIGNPGARTQKQRQFINDVAFENGQDKVNMIPLYTDSTNPFETSAYGTTGNKAARDLIKFAFEVINNDDPSKTTKVHFRAFITNFSDNHSADWNGQKYMGRGENFYTYQGFNREVSFTFKVVAQSKQEMLPLYQKLNYIVSSLYPDYNSNGFMRGNIHQLTIGEYFYRTPGVITSMNVTVDDNYPWEIKYNEPETGRGLNATDQFPNATANFNGTDKFQNSNSDADMMELPQVLNVQVSFKPILNELPALSKHRGNPDDFKNDKRGILISNDVGMQENFINRIDPYVPPKTFVFKAKKIPDPPFIKKS